MFAWSLRRVVLGLVIIVSAQVTFQATPASALPSGVCKAACGSATVGCCWLFKTRCPDCVRMYKPCEAACLVL